MTIGSQLARPTTTPLLNRSHPIARFGRVQAAFVAGGSTSLRDLNLNETGTVSGNPTIVNRPLLGQCIAFDGTGDLVTFSYGNKETGSNGPYVLFLLLIEFNSLAATTVFACQSGTNTGVYLRTNGAGAGLQYVVATKGSFTATSNASVNVPYALAIQGPTLNVTNSVGVLRNLATGEMTTTTVSVTQTIPFGNGSYVFGGNSAISQANCYMAAGAILTSPTPWPTTQMQQWVKDPWLFFYRSPQPTLKFGVTAAGGAVAYILGARRALLGVGR